MADRENIGVLDTDDGKKEVHGFYY